MVTLQTDIFQSYMSDFADSSETEIDPAALLSKGSELVKKRASHWIESANQLPDAEKAALVISVNRKAATILAKIAMLQRASHPLETLRETVLLHLLDLNLSAEAFYTSKQKFIEKQKFIDEDNKAIQGKIHALKPPSALEFKAREEMPLYSQLLHTNKVKAQKNIDQRFYMWHARSTAITANIVALPVTLSITGILGAFGHATETVCQINPNMKKTCNQISNLADNAFERALTLVPGMVIDTINGTKEKVESLVQSQIAYNKDLGISEEKTRQSINDVKKIASLGFGGAAAAGIRKIANKLTPPAKTQAKTLITNNKPVTSAYNQTGSTSAPVSSPTSTDLVSPSSTSVAKKATADEKRSIACDKHRAEISREQSYLKALKMDQPPKLPQNFPQDLNQFFSLSQLHPFERKDLSGKKGWIRDRIRYQPLENSDSAIFLISRAEKRTRSKHELFINGQVIKKPGSKRLNALEKTKETLNEVFDFSKKQGYERVFLVWNPKRHAVISNLPTTDKIRIASMGKFSSGNDKFFELVEVLISK